jgi:hypothetical protein
MRNHSVKVYVKQHCLRIPITVAGEHRPHLLPDGVWGPAPDSGIVDLSSCVVFRKRRNISIVSSTARRKCARARTLATGWLSALTGSNECIRTRMPVQPFQ